MTKEVIYLTGAPATGKSTLTKNLAKLVDTLEVWEYGARLTAYITAKANQSIQQTDLRRQSEKIITPESVKAVDDLLVAFVAERRQTNHILIDSHPVTKESYGYRVTPYSFDGIKALGLSKIWVLYTRPEQAIERIRIDAQGRPPITLEEARFHTELQASVAIGYGMAIGIPVYFFDAEIEPMALAHQMAKRIR